MKKKYTVIITCEDDRYGTSKMVPADVLSDVTYIEMKNHIRNLASHLTFHLDGRDQLILNDLLKAVDDTENHLFQKLTADADNARTYQIGYWSDNPWDGRLVQMIQADTADEIWEKASDHEGFFYQLYDNQTGRRIGYGLFDPESFRNDIKENEKMYHKDDVKECLRECVQNHRWGMPFPYSLGEIRNGALPVDQEMLSAYETVLLQDVYTVIRSSLLVYAKSDEMNQIPAGKLADWFVQNYGYPDQKMDDSIREYFDASPYFTDKVRNGKLVDLRDSSTIENMLQDIEDEMFPQHKQPITEETEEKRCDMVPQLAAELA